MKNFEKILKFHAGLYPKMQPADAVKLAYQSCFGPEHLLSDPDAALRRLFDEYNNIPHENPRRVEELGRLSRLYLDCEMSTGELELVGKMFVNSAKAPKEDMNAFLGKLDLIDALSGEVLPFSREQFRQYRAEYELSGCPAVSHSDIYRESYRPAYRLIDSFYVRLLPVISAISKMGGRAVVAIDGRAASGKSTAAELIAGLFGGEVVHLDDFFLPFDMRTPERLAEPGGNLHRERFLPEVIENLRRGEFEYRVFDCSTGGYKKEPRKIGGSGLIICEGAYSLHPAFGRYYDLAVFSTLSPDEQRDRILSRDGEFMWNNFRERWIPMEEKYFKAFDIEKKCRFVI